MSGLPRPNCAICERPVDRVTAWHKPWDNSTHYVVECHGEREEFDLSHYFLSLAIGPPKIGEAFTAKHLEGPHA